MPKRNARGGWLDLCTDCVQNRCFNYATFSDPELQHVRISADKCLGEGGFGVTYQGVDTLDDSVVACKCLRLAKLNEKRKSELKHETELLRELGHPNVVKLVGAGVRGPDYVIVMEMLVRDLFDIVLSSAEGVAPDRAAQYFADMLRGVAHCHRHGVVHRDVKLENAMVDVRGRVKLIDFGLAHKYLPVLETGAAASGKKPVPGLERRSSNLDKEKDFQVYKLKSIVGSRAYTAPELWSREGYTYPVDIWSCGIALFAMLMKFFPLEQAPVLLYSERYTDGHHTLLSVRG